jgi:hypothetical protein
MRAELPPPPAVDAPSPSPSPGPCSRLWSEWLWRSASESLPRAPVGSGRSAPPVLPWVPPPPPLLLPPPPPPPPPLVPLNGCWRRDCTFAFFVDGAAVGGGLPPLPPRCARPPRDDDAPAPPAFLSAGALRDRSFSMSSASLSMSRSRSFIASVCCRRLEREGGRARRRCAAWPGRSLVRRCSFASCAAAFCMRCRPGLPGPMPTSSRRSMPIASGRASGRASASAATVAVWQ